MLLVRFALPTSDTVTAENIDDLVSDLLHTQEEQFESDKQLVNTFEDVIRERGAPTKLVSIRAQVEITNKVVDILRNYCIGSWQSKPHQQHQNPAER